MFTGFQDNAKLPRYLKASDVLVLPSSGNTPDTWMCPLKLFDYMGSQRPIVASNLAGLKQYLTDGTNALLAEADQAASFVQQMNRLREDHDLRKRLAAQAYADILPFTWDKRVQAIRQHFHLN